MILNENTICIIAAMFLAGGCLSTTQKSAGMGTETGAATGAFIGAWKGNFKWRDNPDPARGQIYVVDHNKYTQKEKRVIHRKKRWFGPQNVTRE